MSPSRYALLVVAALAPGGCLIGPKVGDTITDSDVSQHSFGFSGLSDTKSATVTMSVYTNNALGPLNSAAYSDLSPTVQTASSPGYLPTDTTHNSPFYGWNANINPVAQYPGSFPQGGVARLKARSIYDGQSSAQDMFVMDDTFAACESANYSAGSNWVAIGEACASPYTPKVATVLSTTPTPADKHSGPTASEFYLGQRGGVFPTQALSPNARQPNTVNYYKVTGAEPDLITFKGKFGFGSGGDEVGALYYNYGDLGLGRDMHCRSWTNGQGHLGKACYVTNYGHDSGGKVAFGQDPDTSINQAIAQSNPVATVAMVYDPDNAANMVRFIVFDAGGQRSNFAALDNGGLTAIQPQNLNTPTNANITVPDNCLTCHGIGAQYTAAASGNVSITAARFLAFDPFNLRFSTQNANYADVKVLPQLRALNNLLLGTNLSQAQKDFLAGTYAPNGPSDPNATTHTDWVPTGWAQYDYSTRLYNEVVKPYCRTCHMSQQDADPNAFAGFDWTSYSVFGQNAPNIGFKVCTGNGDAAIPMPQSERTQRLLWASPARAHLLNGLDVGGPCSP
jgi:hypothetical protein